jgi:hypothetical protein
VWARRCCVSPRASGPSLGSSGTADAITEPAVVASLARCSDFAPGFKGELVNVCVDREPMDGIGGRTGGRTDMD